jgi:transcriptional regulator with XRE-family HTH domain
MENIIQKLKTLLEFHNYTEQFLAQHLGIGRNAYSRIEDGKLVNPTLNHLTMIAKHFNISLEGLLICSPTLTFSTDANASIFGAVETGVKLLEEQMEYRLKILKLKKATKDLSEKIIQKELRNRKAITFRIRSLLDFRLAKNEGILRLKSIYRSQANY